MQTSASSVFDFGGGVALAEPVFLCGQPARSIKMAFLMPLGPLTEELVVLTS